MSIFDGVTKSQAQLKFEKISEAAPKILHGEKNRCKASFEDLWGDEKNRTSIEEAQAVLDLFGESAGSVFAYHSAWQTFLKTVDPTWEPLVPPYNVTINENGTVTLTEKETQDA